MYFIGVVNLGLFTSQHIFRRINFDEDGENYESQKHISPGRNKLSKEMVRGAGTTGQPPFFQNKFSLRFSNIKNK
jgi:hypothetical protein